MSSGQIVFICIIVFKIIAIMAIVYELGRRHGYREARDIFERKVVK